MECPRCSSLMILRKSVHGQFWGCSTFPACRGTRPYEEGEESTSTKPTKEVERSFEPIVKMGGSDEQEAIWSYLLKGRSHMVVNAGPGTGKTWTCIQSFFRLPKDTRIASVAFNRHIAREAQGKLRASGITNVLACTYHSLGYKILRSCFSKLQDPDENKVRSILENNLPDTFENRKLITLVNKLVGLAKGYFIDHEASDFAEKMLVVADHHGLELNGNQKQAIDMVPGVMKECVRRASTSIDFDDMIWLPVVMELPIYETYDLMFVDEFQDTDRCQHEFTMRVGAKSRIVIVGDERQAIYAWRGADTTSIPTMTERLRQTDRGVKTFPLTITRRCPKSHVALVQSISPDISAVDDAPEGEILSMSEDKAVAAMQPGDMAICRTNKQLIPIAYDLIRRGLKPMVRGRDLGTGLLKLVEKLEKSAFNMDEMTRSLEAYRFKEETKLLREGEKAEGRLQSLRDKCDCLMEFIRNSDTIEEMKKKISEIFADFDADGAPKNVVILGTIHRTKGLESTRVFVLAPELIPHPMARKDWEIIGERNLAWVAGTRAKYDRKTGAVGTIVFCGSIPSIYSVPVKEVSDAQDPVRSEEVQPQSTGGD